MDWPMAIGDVVSGLSALNTALTFQPAAGVEAVITSCPMDDSANIAPLLDDATLVSSFFTNAALAAAADNYMATKIFVTNTNFLSYGAAGVGLSSGFTGVQTK